MRIETLQPKFVEFIPRDLENGVLYISERFKTSSHLCCCGCGNTVVTPLKPGGWRLSVHNGMASLNPSIGNWALPCRSHYIIRDNQVRWAKQYSDRQIKANRERDEAGRAAHFGAAIQFDAKPGIFKRIWRYLFGK